MSERWWNVVAVLVAVAVLALTVWLTPPLLP